MATSDLRPKVKIRPFRACTIKICNITLFMAKLAKFSRLKRKYGSRNRMVMSDLRAEVEIWPFCACAMHPAIIIETVRSL